MKAALKIVLQSARRLANSDQEDQDRSGGAIEQLRIARELALRTAASIEGEILQRC